MGAISNLACIRSHQPAILEAGAAPLLLRLMQPGMSAGCQEAAARGFGNLVRFVFASICFALFSNPAGSRGATTAAAKAPQPAPQHRPGITLPPAARLPPPPRPQVCDSLSDTLRPVAYQAVPLLVGIMQRADSGSNTKQVGALQAPLVAMPGVAA